MQTELARRALAARLVFAAGVLVLAASPIAWLIHTWTDPAFDSPGAWVCAVVAALFLASWRSARLAPDPADTRIAHRLLIATALVRLASQVLDVDVLGGCALVVDVYALGRLAGLARRRRALSPAWLALLFAFALPIERILQRVAGYPLQWWSARITCGGLRLALPDVHCAGVSIAVDGHQVLVDLPCSGARGLVALGILFVALAAIRRPSPARALCGVALALASAVATNVVRLAVLALGGAFAPGGVDVMAAPWHEAIGSVALALGTLPIIAWARATEPTVPRAVRDRAHPSAPRLAHALGFAAVAIAVTLLPQRPIDASAPVEPLPLPASLLGYPRQLDPLSEKERRYFTRYGGRAVKARYGPYGVLAVTTTAPLRHLHAPDECLRGSGHQVRLLGSDNTGRLPSAIYRSRPPDGGALRIAATFVSDRGDYATSVSEAAWRWLQEEHSVWTELQRIAPDDTPPAALRQLDDALAAALELPRAPPQPARPASSPHPPPAHQEGT
ncbi:MAG: exosortase T [Deltaproteobacteria bacterium]|nr:exosortase T [Deltaproteobacteria bacterium]